MATLEKLVKALEGLKILQLTPQITDDSSVRKKEKIAHCLTIADTMCQSGIKGAPNFSHLLSIAIEILLQLCDDTHADVRMIADESLNRIIKAMADSNVVKIQVELHKEIKKNGSARTLRAALWRFAELCHMIRPQKGKPYVLNLVPCIIQIAKRSEEPVLETLAAAMPKIFKALGNFTTDNDIKSLLKAFLHNLSAPSAVVRRTAATSILAICVHCRKPHVFITYVLNTLLDCVVPLCESQPAASVLGVLGCLRCILPHVASAAEAQEEMWGSFGVRRSHREAPPSVDRMIQVYELCLHYSSSPDHNIVVAALETLQQLLQAPPPDLLQALLDRQGISRSRVTTTYFDSAVSLTQRSLSQMSVAPSLAAGDESALLDLDPDDVSLRMPSIERWVGEVQSAVAAPEDPFPSLDPKADIQDEEGLSLINTTEAEYSNICIGNIKDDDDPEAYSDMMMVTLPMRKPVCKPLAVSAQPSVQSEDSRASGTPSPPCAHHSPPYQQCDIGSFTDADVPLVHCARRLAASFLLTGVRGYMMPDSSVRVSSKALALHCLSACLRLHPCLFLLPLDKRCSAHEHGSLESEHQPLSDVLLYASHCDPQLRGITSLLVATLLQAVLREGCGGAFAAWRLRHDGPSPATLSSLLDVLLKGLRDESSVCCRHTLGALTLCLTDLLESVNCVAAEGILKALPPLANNSYWLVKVKLLELLGGLPYVAIHHLSRGCTGAQDFQEKVTQEVLMTLLADEDARVRHAAVTACVKIVPRLFFPVDHPQQDAVTACGIAHRAALGAQPEGMLQQGSINSINSINSLPAPFNVFNQGGAPVAAPVVLEAALSRFVNRLSHALLVSSSKFQVYGCCEALSMLSEHFLTTVHPRAWGCCGASHTKGRRHASKRSSSSSVSSDTAANMSSTAVSPASGLLSVCLSLLTASPLSLDLSCQCWLVTLAGNLFSGLAVWSLRPAEGNQENHQKGSWAVLRDKQLACAAEQLLVHLIRVLNVFVHVLEETPPVPPAPKPSLPSLPTAPSLSPIKRKSKSDGLQGASPVHTSAEKEEKTEEKRSGRGTCVGSFAHCPHYVRIYEVTRNAYTNYKIMLDASASEKFVCLLRTTLEALSQVLEVASLAEVGRLAEETLSYLRLTVLVVPTATVKCVQQLLKCLFGTNLSAQWGEAEERQLQALVMHSMLQRTQGEGFYALCFHQPYQQLSERVASTNKHNDLRDERSMKVDRRGLCRGADKAALAAYIRLFEPMVIKALKQYTVTSDVRLQCRVLLLLCQLVQLRVNYCLLDSDQIFIGFVLKQFEFIEEGQIPLAEKLVPRIFYFLVHLSYEKNHSKSIIGVPKVIQLCDGLMASGQPPTSHCIPALVPVVEDVFLTRGRGGAGAELKELETQREVIVSMLLRLVEYHQVLDLLSAVLSERESDERWRRWSRQVADALLPLLAQGRVRLESRTAQQALNRLLASCAPSVLRPADDLLRVLFASPPGMSSLVGRQRWLGAVLGVQQLLLGQGKEEAVLARLEELDLPLPPLNDPRSPDPLNARSASTAEHKLPPEQLMARLLLRVVGLVVRHIHSAMRNVALSLGLGLQGPPGVDWHYLQEQFSTFLLFCIYMFESGSYCRVATAAIQLLQEHSDSADSADVFPVEEVNTMFKDLAPRCPMLTVQWCYLLALLNYNKQSFWASVLRTQPAHPILGQGVGVEGSSGPSKCANIEVVRRGSTIVFCDYVCENLGDAQQLTWLLVNHIEEVVRLSLEPPVHELIAAVHRSSAASGLLVQAVATCCQEMLQPSFAVGLLRCLQCVHPSQSGALLTLLVPRLVAHPHVAVARLAASLACRRAELLLTLSPEEVTSQLSRDNLQALVRALQAAHLDKKHSGLLSVLTKLGACGREEQSAPLQAGELRSLALDKDWFLQQVKQRCCLKSASGAESAQLLSKLDYEDILAVLNCPDFNALLLRDCIQLGTLLTLQAYQSLPEPKASYSNENYVELQQRTTALESPLYIAARKSLLDQVTTISTLIPRPHHVFLPVGRMATSKEQKYASRLQQLMAEPCFINHLFEIAPAVICYLSSLPALAWGGAWPPVPPCACEDLAKFGVLCLEVAHGLLAERCSPHPHCLEQCLRCAEAVLREPNLAAVLGSQVSVAWVASAVSSLTAVITFLLEGHQMPQLPPHALSKALEDPEAAAAVAGHACHQMTVLVLWLEHLQSSEYRLPMFLATTVKSLVISLARMPVVNSYVVTPPDVWRQGWAPELGGPFSTTVPPLPVDCLQDIDVLQQLVFRMTLLGWTSRQQFEETWMALLSVLSSHPGGLGLEGAGAGGGGEEEQGLVVQACVLAVQALTTLLVQTLLLPLPGHPGTSTLLHQPRMRPLAHTSTCQAPPQLRAVHELLLWHLRHSAPQTALHHVYQHVYQRANPERINNPQRYGYSQVSVDYLWTATRMMAQLVRDANKRLVSARCLEREQCLAVSGLDLHSCLHFLLDLYSQWTLPHSGTPLCLVSAAVRSVLALSDLFTERAQFTWMLATFLELSRLHPPEDDVLHQYLVLGACKAAAVLLPDAESGGDRVRRLLEGALRSPFLPTRLAALHGLLYLLQAEHTAAAAGEGVASLATEYLQQHFAGAAPDSGGSEEHALLLWALAFYLLEAQGGEKEGGEGEAQSLLCSVLSAASAASPPSPSSSHIALLQGLERLVAVGVVGAEQVAQLAVEKLKDQNPARSLPALQLLLTCMYTEKPVMVNSELEQPVDPVEQLIHTMEKTSALFDRIKRGYPSEVAVLCSVLPSLLTDFFPPSEMLSKVVAEFLSPQQPHPRLLASVVFQVFERASQQPQLALLQAWVVLSLPNFTCSSPVAMAAWCLTCFFISASPNPWLRALFPHVQSRIGRLEYEDRQLLCIAAADFYNHLTDETQKRTFVSTFEAAAASQPQTPFADLVACL